MSQATKTDYREVNFDGLVGPTHNYSGLAHGNVASMRHGGLVSNPREAALQGLAKMKALMDAGYAQGVLPPQQRPDLGALRSLGFTGSNREVLARAAAEAPQVLRAVCSASSMWTANAGTVTPSRDAPDGRAHFTPANLQSSFHRFLEPETTGRVLAAIFRDEAHFAHHPALPATPAFSDEGAANHTRLCGEHGEAGVHLYVYGRQAFGGDPAHEPKRFPARQTLEASQAVARQHGLAAAQTVFAQQHPEAIDAGVFHNDVIAVGNGPVLLYHEMAFLDEQATLDELRSKMSTPLIPVRVPGEAVSLEDAVASYLFNSQLLSNPDGRMTLVVPGECQEREAVWRTIQDLLLAGHNPIGEVIVKDVKQSMRNGGGPACLRLRVALSAEERAALTGRVLLTDALHGELAAWVERHYRDRLAPDDLADPQLADETLTALDELTRILDIGSVYPFQLG
ncbi:N-succinylarginine dihydrolase [Halomonas sp. MCCC 1A17488]|uniref:N-succinylarginine dihydrolase n=1 Tax=Billgrantia sulfidoxydans TaxID=2733484 RepID=A0ABX7W7J4_9GAMM|nr:MULTISPECIES: N-succinylarginine dihydrolase [Halomonas]MCE8017796.1 N-succinylarginine dihydrolase [Halomonas sp. MCCC 1A17488]MCG3241129.1 N-succinylarginine dihydrolase [Halomonas sp. MCCC 1A17488]QPP48983.1 N-succinylarginine dihydrolase [Halomonas sp. SS10-MC5]QTP56301.1 N-succinylarginine dihydrolase [Halomonas sulfidoxydans]